MELELVECDQPGIGRAGYAVVYQDPRDRVVQEHDSEAEAGADYVRDAGFFHRDEPWHTTGLSENEIRDAAELAKQELRDAAARRARCISSAP